MDVDKIIDILENVKKLKEIGIKRVRGKVLPVISIAGANRKGIRVDKLDKDITCLTFVELPNLPNVFIVLVERNKN